MKRGPSKRTMERALSDQHDDGDLVALTPEDMEKVRARLTKSAGPLLTDWIPCTTPPVREGAYQFIMPGVVGNEPADAVFKEGKWFDPDGGPLPGLTAKTLSHLFSWRGVRRWVLVKPSATIRDGRLVYLQKVPSRGRRAGVPHWHFHLAEAMGFDTETEAHAFRLANCLGAVTAVLP